MPVTCARPYCLDQATDYIPLPEGSRRTQVFLCAPHAEQARTDCYYVCSLKGVESEEGFYKAVRAKHKRIRGNDKLAHTTRAR